MEGEDIWGLSPCHSVTNLYLRVHCVRSVRFLCWGLFEGPEPAVLAGRPCAMPARRCRPVTSLAPVGWWPRSGHLGTYCAGSEGADRKVVITAQTEPTAETQPSAARQAAPPGARRHLAPAWRSGAQTKHGARRPVTSPQPAVRAGPVVTTAQPAGSKPRSSPPGGAAGPQALLATWGLGARGVLASSGSGSPASSLGWDLSASPELTVRICLFQQGGLALNA